MNISQILLASIIKQNKDYEKVADKKKCVFEGLSYDRKAR